MPGDPEGIPVGLAPPSQGENEAALGAEASDTDRAEVLEVLDRGVLRSRSLDIFPSAYMTVVSIVQGAALALLIPSSFGAVRNSDGLERVATLSQAAVTWATIVVIFYMYVWYTLVVRYAPTVLDSILPLALGSAEIAMGQAIGEPVIWLWATLVTAVCGLLAFLNSLMRATQDMYVPEDADSMVRILRKLVIAESVIVAASAVFAVFAVFVAEPAWCSVGMLILTVLLFWMVWVSEAGLGDIYKRHQLIRHDWDWANLGRRTD